MDESVESAAQLCFPPPLIVCIISPLDCVLFCFVFLSTKVVLRPLYKVCRFALLTSFQNDAKTHMIVIVISPKKNLLK